MKKIYLFFVPVTFACIAHAQQTVKTPVKATAGNSKLSGIFCAPTGTNVVLQMNGKADLSLVAGKETGKNFTENNFSFPVPIPNDSKIKVSLKTIPNGKTCTVYSGSEGVVPQNANSLRVACDFKYDLISRSSNDGAFSTFYETYDPAIGGNAGEEGRYVVFISSASGYAGSTGKHRQVFLRDRNTGITKLISAASNGEEGNGDSYLPSISDDGKTVAFESLSTNLVQADKNSVKDIFVWKANTNNIETVSIGIGGVEANAESMEPAVSGDGKYIAFTSMASNISTTEKGTSNNNVFLRDLQAGTTVMISVDPSSKKGGGGSRPSISYDGNRIAFYSDSGTLVAVDNNGFWDIFLWRKTIRN